MIEIVRRAPAPRCATGKVFSMSLEPSHDQVRASDRDREQILGVLQDGLAQGRITMDEYTERTDATLVARTMGELRVVINDLPVSAMQTDIVAPTIGGATVEWRGSFSSLKRAGNWQVPARIVLRRRMGSVELDFTEAQFTSRVVDIVLDIVGGSVEIRVPEGAGASFDEVDVTLGSTEDHRKVLSTTGSGGPHIRFTGSIRMGSLEIRGPKRRLFR
jgi:Domain of unknown function (DUF1707)